MLRRQWPTSDGVCPLLKNPCCFIGRCVSGCSHYTSGQDGGPVAEDLRPAVQCGQDHAV